MEKGCVTMLGVFLAGCALIGLIIWITNDDTIEDQHRHKIEQLKRDADLAGQYAHVSELKYCIRNVKFTDSLLREVDKMLDDSTMSYHHQYELIDIREDLKMSRTMSNVEVLLHKIEKY